MYCSMGGTILFIEGKIHDANEILFNIRLNLIRKVYNTKS